MVAYFIKVTNVKQQNNLHQQPAASITVKMAEHSASQLSELAGDTSNFSDLPSGRLVNNGILNSSALSITRQSTITAATSITQLTHDKP